MCIGGGGIVMSHFSSGPKQRLFTRGGVAHCRLNGVLRLEYFRGNEPSVSRVLGRLKLGRCGPCRVMQGARNIDRGSFV